MESVDQDLYRMLPAVHELMERPEVLALQKHFAREAVLQSVRILQEELRSSIRAGTTDQAGFVAQLDGFGARLQRALRDAAQPRLRRVVNATGVLLQTNLGRAPLSEAALRHIRAIARGYCNVEFDLEAGKRSRRDALTEDLLVAVATEQAPAGMAAAVVNNCAAATFLALNTLAEGGEVIVSRGELVEIGGGFRIPEILEKSGAKLREVGTTNKTRSSDYAGAIGPQTRLILRVHRSNFCIEGFTEQPELTELVELGARAGVPVFDDQGTGCVVDLARVGLPGQASWVSSVRSGAALVAASGDKLLGGPQCGLLVGHHEVVERLRANPLFRALRVDKLTYAALEATLQAYALGREEELPLVQMLQCPAETIRQRCEIWVDKLRSATVRAEVVPCGSVVGGGTTPGATLPSFAVALEQVGIPENELASKLRQGEPPIVARIQDGRVLLDLRTVEARDDHELMASVSGLLATG